jgi:diacylglycerol kinase family enzyme
MGNVFAKEIGVPRSPEAALRVLVDGDERRFDLGLAGGRYFLCMCGLGLDAEVVRKVPANAKRLLGSASLLLWGAMEAPRRQGTRATLRFGENDEQELDLYWALLGNTRSYGGVINVTAKAVVDDGLLDAYVFAGRRLPLGTAARVAVGRHHDAPGVEFRRIAHLDIPTPGIGVQADGEYFGETPMTFSVAPGALRFLLPPGKGRRLFSR